MWKMSHFFQDYTVDLYLRQFWRDTRLMFDNFDKSEERTSLTIGIDMVKSIWTPDTVSFRVRTVFQKNFCSSFFQMKRNHFFTKPHHTILFWGLITWEMSSEASDWPWLPIVQWIFTHFRWMSRCALWKLKWVFSTTSRFVNFMATVWSLFFLNQTLLIFWHSNFLLQQKIIQFFS